MIEPIANALYQHALQQYPASQAYTVEDLRVSQLPEEVKHYLTYLLEQKARHELRKLSMNWFDASNPDVIHAQHMYARALTQTVHIPASEWEKVLHKAIRSVLEYLVLPIQTLAAPFQNTSSIPVEDILDWMHHFKAYPYFAKVLKVYLDERSLSHLSSANYISLIQKIDQKITAEYTPQNWLAHLEPLFNLFTFLPSTPQGVPTTLIRWFFREKGHGEIQRKLLHIEQVENKEYITPHQLVHLLNSIQPEPLASVPLTTGPLPLWMKYAKQAPASSSFSSKPTSDTLPLWQRFAQNIAPAPSFPSSISNHTTPIKNLLEELEEIVLGKYNPALRTLFVQHIFKNDQAGYQAILHKLSKASSWEEASQIIARDVFLKYGVNIYSEPAVMFTDLVEARFQQNAT